MGFYVCLGFFRYNCSDLKLHVCLWARSLRGEGMDGESCCGRLGCILSQDYLDIC